MNREARYVSSLSTHIILDLLNAGKVTSLVAKKDVLLATRIEEAIRKNESLEALTSNNVRRPSNPQNANPKGRNTSRTVKSSSALKITSQQGRRGVVLSSKSRTPKDTTSTRRRSTPKSQPKPTKSAPKSAPAGKAKLAKSTKTSIKVSKSQSKPVGRKGDALNKIGTKLSVVGFRGRSSGKSAQTS